jgi:four helix bundle protein
MDSRRRCGDPRFPYPRTLPRVSRNEVGPADKARLMNIAQGSLEELRYYVILAADLGHLGRGALQQEVEEASRLLEAYVQKLLPTGS